MSRQGLKGRRPAGAGDRTGSSGFGAADLGIDASASRARGAGPLELAGAALASAAHAPPDQPPNPLLPVDLLRRPVFALSVLASTFSFAAQGMMFVVHAVLLRGTCSACHAA